jgi:phosphate transport system protein
VIRGDDEVDQLYLDVERRILGLFALQTPVASDLRLLTALLHINLHLERIADQAVNLAKITKLAHGLPPNPTVLQHLGEMGALALGMAAAAMAALARRDLELARSLPELDDPLDRLNRGMLGQVLAASDDKRMLEWGIRMYVVSRQLERIGDNAVDIAEQVAFLVTGSSASSPMPRIRRSNTPSCWRAAGHGSRPPLSTRPATGPRSARQEGNRSAASPGRHAGQHEDRPRAICPSSCRIAIISWQLYSISANSTASGRAWRPHGGLVAWAVVGDGGDPVSSCACWMSWPSRSTACW